MMFPIIGRFVVRACNIRDVLILDPCGFSASDVAELVTSRLPLDPQIQELVAAARKVCSSSLVLALLYSPKTIVF